MNRSNLVNCSSPKIAVCFKKKTSLNTLVTLKVQERGNWTATRSLSYAGSSSQQIKLSWNVIPATNNIFKFVLPFFGQVPLLHAQVVAADDWVKKQPRIITESVRQHQMEAGSRRAKKLSKRRISESEAECCVSSFLLLFSPQNAIHWRQKFFSLGYLHKF